MRIKQRYKRDKETIAKLVLLGASCAEAGEELGVDPVTAWKLMNLYFDELGSINDEKSEALRKEFLSELLLNMKSVKKLLFRTIEDSKISLKERLLAAKVYTGHIKVQMEVLSRLRIIDPLKLEIKQEEDVWTAKKAMAELEKMEVALKQANEGSGGE